LKALPLGAAALLGLGPRPLRAWSLFRAAKHPEPRPGIDASKVLTTDRLVNPAAGPGIRCTCGCAELPGYYSLLTCFEEGGMAQFCEICQGQARLAHRRHGEGQSLDQIRNAVDARFGHGGRPDSVFGRLSVSRSAPGGEAAWCGPEHRLGDQDLPQGGTAK
jgi:hypothetical protein